MKINWSAWIDLQDRKIRSAQGQSVKSELIRLNLRQIPREWIADIADLARRLNLSYFTLRLLAPYVRPVVANETEASNREKAQYALALARLGAFQESEQLLQELRLKLNGDSKDILFLQASAYLSQWNSQEAKKIYQSLHLLPSLSEYEKRIVEINLASCLVDLGQFSEAVQILKPFEALKKNHQLLYGNSRELMAQALIGLENYEQAELLAIESVEVLDSGTESDSLFAKKWLLIIRSLARQTTSEADWNHVRDLATRAKDYETLRDLDFYESCIQSNRDKFLRVYFGTTFPSYRIQALKKFKLPIAIPVSLQISPSPPVPATAHLDLQSGLFTQGESRVQISGLKLSLLRALSRDFYRSLPIGELFSTLYPNEIFDVHSSPHRIFQMIQNLRKFLSEKQIPLQIELSDHLYRLQTGPITLQVYLTYHNHVEATNPCLDQMRDWLHQNRKQAFSRSDLQVAFQLSKTTAIQWLKEGINAKLFQKKGSGNRSLYHPRRQLIKKTG